MAKARINNPQQAGALMRNPTASSAGAAAVPPEIVAAQQTGVTIPTPENVPAVRKKAVELQQELQHQTQISAPAPAVAQAPNRMPPPGSPTKPTTESNLFAAPGH